MLLCVSIQISIADIIPSIRTRRDHLNASWLRSQYLIKTSKRTLFRWQQTHSCSPGISANEGEEMRSTFHFQIRTHHLQSFLRFKQFTWNISKRGREDKTHLKRGRRFEMQSNNTYHSKYGPFARELQFGRRDISTATQTRKHHFIICMGKRGRRIEDQHQVT